jgi:lipoate-protein ligase A
MPYLVMPVVDLIVQPSVDADVSAAVDRYLMRAVGRRARAAVLRIYALDGDVVSLGRYHLAPAPPAAGGARIVRRHSGGQALPFGEGFVGISLILPHRSTWFGANPFALAPYQVLNRYVRGVLEACRIAQLPVNYPGRDFVTVNRRVIGAVSFETDESGTLLFEAILCCTRDFSILPALLERVDPEGTVRIQMLDHGATSLAEALQDPMVFADIAELLQRGFAKQFSLQLEANPLSSLEWQVIEGLAARECAQAQWVFQRRPRAELDHHATVSVQLGVFEAHLALQQQRFIKEAVFAGDFIAASGAIEALEHRLRLVPVDGRAIESLTNEIFSDPRHFVLGIGKLRTITDAILRAAGE